MNPGYRRPRPAPGTDSDHGYSTMTPYGDQVGIAPHLNTVSDEVLNFFCSVANPGFVSRIRTFQSRIQGQKDSGPRIRLRIKEFKYFLPKKLCLSSRKFRIPGSKRHQTPYPGSAILLLKADLRFWITSLWKKIATFCVENHGRTRICAIS